MENILYVILGANFIILGFGVFSFIKLRNKIEENYQKSTNNLSLVNKNVKIIEQNIEKYHIEVGNFKKEINTHFDSLNEEQKNLFIENSNKTNELISLTQTKSKEQLEKLGESILTKNETMRKELNKKIEELSRLESLE